MAFKTNCGKDLNVVQMGAHLLLDELDGVDITLTETPKGKFKAEFSCDVSWMSCDKKDLLKQAIEYLEEKVIKKGWWSDVAGVNGEEIIAFDSVKPLPRKIRP